MSASRDPKWRTSIRELVLRASASSLRETSQLCRATSSSAACACRRRRCRSSRGRPDAATSLQEFVCTENLATPPEAQRQRVRANTRLEFSAGHHPFLSRPDEFAESIVAAMTAVEPADRASAWSPTTFSTRLCSRDDPATTTRSEQCLSRRKGGAGHTRRRSNPARRWSTTRPGMARRRSDRKVLTSLQSAHSKSVGASLEMGVRPREAGLAIRPVGGGPIGRAAERVRRRSSRCRSPSSPP